MASGFFGAAQDAFDVHLLPEAHHMRRLGQLLAGLFPGRERCGSVRVGEGPGSGVPDRKPVARVEELVMRWPPDLVVGGGGDLAEFGAGDGAPEGGVKMWGAA